ncbi:MAG: hypothetical protein Tsb0013_18250 [Phycisphaerales bacterium]
MVTTILQGTGTMIGEVTFDTRAGAPVDAFLRTEAAVQVQGKSPQTARSVIDQRLFTELTISTPDNDAPNPDTSDATDNEDDLPTVPDIQDFELLVRSLPDDGSIELISAGNARAGTSTLRFSPEPGATKDVIVTTAFELIDDEDNVGEIEQVTLPAYQQRVRRTAVTDPDGATTRAVATVTEADILPDDTADPRVIRGAQAGVRALVGNTYTHTIDPTRTHDYRETNADNQPLPPSSTSDLGWTDMRLTLPDQPVAPGARWRWLEQPTNTPGMTAYTVRDVTLLRADDHTFTLRLEITKLALLKNERDFRAELRELAAVTQGQLTFSRALATPIEGHLTTVKWQNQQMATFGQAQMLQQGAVTRVTIEPAQD